MTKPYLLAGQKAALFTRSSSLNGLLGALRVLVILKLSTLLRCDDRRAPRNETSAISIGCDSLRRYGSLEPLQSGQRADPYGRCPEGGLPPSARRSLSQTSFSASSQSSNSTPGAKLRASAFKYAVSRIKR